MDISANSNWSSDLSYVGIKDKDFLGFLAQLFNVIFGKRFAISKLFDISI